MGETDAERNAGSTTPQPAGGPHPQFTDHSCYEIWCADCGTDVWENSDSGLQPHFDATRGVAATIRELVESWDWSNDGALLCRSCTDKRTCLSDGHLWSPWREPRTPAVTRWRSCERCGEFGADDAGGV